MLRSENDDLCDTVEKRQRCCAKKNIASLKRAAEATLAYVDQLGDQLEKEIRGIAGFLIQFCW